MTTAASIDFDLTAPERFQDKPRIAVLIPCFNEELTVIEVVRQFRAHLPPAEIYVFDNNSSDRTAQRAQEAGATVIYERRQGKGYVVQSMFRQVEADIYLLVDGDGAHSPDVVQKLIQPIMSGEADMVVGTRWWQDRTQNTCKHLNRAGNRFFRLLLNTLFGVRLTDVLSGYRAFSRDFVKDVPLTGGGFEIEVELTIKAIEHRYRILEVPINVSQRPPGSHSKIHVTRDGFVILNTVLRLFCEYKPLTFFGLLLTLIGAGSIAVLAILTELMNRGLAWRPFLAVLGVALILSGMFSLSAGLLWHMIKRRAQESDHPRRLWRSESL